MRSTVLLPLTGLFLTLVPCHAQVAPPQTGAGSSVQTFKSITLVYRRLDSAVAEHSPQKLLACNTQNYVIVDAKGKVLFRGGPKMTAQWTKTLSAATHVKQTTSVQKLSIIPTGVKATILQRLQLSAMDPEINNWRTWVIDWQMEDSWSKIAGSWRRTRTVMLAQNSVKRPGPIQ
jgi:hypothetical protein